MAHGNGLGFSTEIKGSIGKALTFSKNQHAKHVKFFWGKNRNKNKNTSIKQLAQREVFSMCNNLYNTLTEQEKIDFDYRYTNPADTKRNNFMSFCLTKKPAVCGNSICGISVCGVSPN